MLSRCFESMLTHRSKTVLSQQRESNGTHKINGDRLLAQRGSSMHRVQERRLHDRAERVCSATVTDRAGRTLLRGRTADISPGGVRIVGPSRGDFAEGVACHVELSVPNPAAGGRPRRVVKLDGQVRRVCDMGEWKSIVVVFENDLTKNLFLSIG
jgi:hypothetical protein